MDIRKIALFCKRKRSLKILFALSGESHDDIRGKRGIRHFLADVAHDIQVSCLVVMAVHGLEYLITSRLQRQVELMRDML